MEKLDIIANIARRLTELERYTYEAPTEDIPVATNEEIDEAIENYRSNNDDQESLIQSVCSDVSALLIRKNRDYGDSFAKQYAKYGIQSALIRLDDKMARLETLSSGQEARVKDESIDDTCLDAIGYLILTLVERRKENL